MQKGEVQFHKLNPKENPDREASCNCLNFQSELKAAFPVKVKCPRNNSRVEPLNGAIGAPPSKSARFEGIGFAPVWKPAFRFMGSLCLLAVALCFFSARAKGPVINSTSAISKPANVFDLAGHPLNPFAAADDKAVVFIFVRTDCPVSNRYAPEIRRLHAKYAPQHVAFWLVYPNPDSTIAAIQDHLKQYQFDVSPLRDPKHTLVKESGVSITPEAAVFLPDRHEVYRGRIDNKFVALGRERPVATQHDLDEVLSSVVSGRNVTNKFTKAVGCYISDLQ